MGGTAGVGVAVLAGLLRTARRAPRRGQGRRGRARLEAPGHAFAAPRMAAGGGRTVARGRSQAEQGHRREGAGSHRRTDSLGDPGFGSGDHDDPGLPDPRPPAGQPRPPRPDPAGRERRVGPRLLRLRRGGFRPSDLPRLCAGSRKRAHARDHRHPAAHLLRQCRRAVHAHLRPRGEGLDPGADRGPRQGDRLHPRGQDRHPEEADRGRGLRALPAQALPRHQAVRPRRRRSPGPGHGADHQARRRPGRSTRSCSACPTAAA